MPVHVGEVESDVTVMDGDMPFSDRQMERLVEMVCKRLEQKKREREQVNESTTLAPNARRARVGD